MIFVTVGTQLPFDRLVTGMDEWAKSNPSTPVIAQIGSTRLRPDIITFHDHYPPEEFKKLFAAAALVVSHAGIGTIILALQSGKPLVVMPRRNDLAEHRNNHQMATAARLQARNIHVVHDQDELKKILARPETWRPVTAQTLELSEHFKMSLISLVEERS